MAPGEAGEGARGQGWGGPEWSGGLTRRANCRTTGLVSVVRRSRMKLVVLVVFLAAGPALEVLGEVPRGVVRSAEEATKALGAQVLKGNFAFSIQKMYPRWKERAAKRKGGMEKLVAELLRAPAEMQAKGITMLEFQTGVAKGRHEVHAVLVPDSEGREVRVFKEWLVIVPTTTRFRVIDPESRVVKRIETYGFQVAIADKDQKEWTFIDGSNLGVSDLRRFFPSLPADRDGIGMPLVGGKEIK